MDWQMDEWPETEVRPAANTATRDPVPEGRHRFEIVRASEDGPKLKLALCRLEGTDQDKRFAWVWVDAFRDKDWGRRLVASLAGGLGIAPGEWNATKVADLEGRVVEAEIYHKQAATALFVNVSSFHKPEAAPEPKPARKAAAAKHLETDDIQF